MAVQAQHLHSSLPFSLNFRDRSFVVDELQKLQKGNGDGNVLGGGVVYGTTVFSVGGFCPQESGLTCNISAYRKFALDDLPMAALPAHLRDDHTFPPVAYRFPALAAAGLAPMNSAAAAETGVTSTSGRPLAMAAASSSLLAQDLVSHLYQHNLEVDALVRLQTERLQATLEEAREKHCLMLLSALDQQVMRLLLEKEAELESAVICNAELEEKIRQMSAENQIWINVARNNEALVSTLRTNLEQVLETAAVLSGGAAAAAVLGGGAAAAAGIYLREGFGDSDDGRSCCFYGGRRPEGEGEDEESLLVRGRRGACRVCGEGDVSVLLLPCRHLCLCKICESKADTCPVCRSPKNASIQILS